MKRTVGLDRPRRRSARRDWTLPREKVDAEARCRVCGRPDQLEAAHLIPRSRVKVGLGEHPDNIVPLCGGPDGCHGKYDRREFELLPYLTVGEQACATYCAGGITLALRYLSGKVWQPVEGR